MSHQVQGQNTHEIEEHIDGTVWGYLTMLSHPKNSPKQYDRGGREESVGSQSATLMCSRERYRYRAIAIGRDILDTPEILLRVSAPLLKKRLRRDNSSFGGFFLLLRIPN